MANYTKIGWKESEDEEEGEKEEKEREKSMELDKILSCMINWWWHELFEG